ncbi:MAG: energy-coupling factor ABC transporter substrate-binding protein [Methanosphaera sp.]|uniref:energy-coupling factor ABC transporter substrate-binding protein n=1 Tax=Methanosphaera sp. TaxID=2666342 RepID=UPI0025D35DE4|nr:energy-coupling factor ABC transporter substrate-binding protein [Methanosphaera sp.]MCI5867747.1 energy-coupling factor ABC transporter substrate-binding protein [Methanosphaera sp.]MDD6535294.1 energy-coupling factor ABC transporter substrate-binding protein [Methanosphaera sp.]MDY3956455.1 energy-coupling factor ABC transporter substrate-binding protein [Methanosphaera sp.]
MVDTKTIIGLIIVAVLIVAPLTIYNGHGEDDGYFGGSDDQGGDQVAVQNPNYEVWAEPLWEPPSGEIECLIFCLQAAVGGLIIGYVFGKWNRGGKVEQ